MPIPSRLDTQNLDVEAFDPWDCAMSEQPFPYFAAMRERSPVHHVAKRGMWMLTRYDDVAAALRDTESFSSSFVYVGEPMSTPTLDELEANWLPVDSEGNPADASVPHVAVDPSLVDPDDQTPLLPSLAESDPPEHTRIRRMLTRQMSVTRIAELERGIRELTNELFDGLIAEARDSGAADFKALISNPLTLRVSGLLMNIPESDVAMLGRLAEDSVGLFSLVPAVRKAMDTAYQPYAKYFRDRYTGRIAVAPTEGRTDLMQSLLQPNENGEQMSEEEFAANAAVIFRAGFETTANLLVNGLHALFDNPEQLDLLRSDPSLIPSAVEEMLRYVGPLRGLFRVTANDVTIRGTTIPKGSFVHVMFASAGRDEEHYPNAGEFLIERNPRDHFAFGGFKHLCLGANLARMEAQVVFETLLERTRNVRKAGPAPMIRHAFIYGRTQLPITFDLA